MRVPSNIYKRLPLWATRAIDAYQIWDAQLGGWLSRMAAIAMSAGGMLWTYLGESWLPMAIVAGGGLYILAQKALSSGTAAMPSSITAPYTNDGSTDDEAALHDLTIFAVDYVLPLGYAHYKLQIALLTRSIPDALPASLAIGNLMSNHNILPFGEHYDALSIRFTTSPMGCVPFKELKGRILLMDKNFSRLIEQTDQLAAAVGADYRTDDKLTPLWRNVCARHNELVAEYKKIKRDRRFAPELYRPGIDGPWTEEVH